MRKTYLSIGEIYHIYNRGVDKREIFLDDSYYRRFHSILKHYLQYDYPHSHLVTRSLNNNDLQSLTLKLESYKWREPLIEIISYNLLPNHFHLQVRQLVESGISTFMHRIGTAFTNYFNIRNDRSGSLYEGSFKAKRVESEGQFLCLSRYIHLNPLSAGLVTPKNILDWKWSSLPQYVGKDKNGICSTKDILHCFKDEADYLDFILADFNEVERQSLEGLTIDDDFGWFKDREGRRRRVRSDLMAAIRRS